MSNGPFPLPTLGPTITAAGITIPPFEDILASLQASYRGVYGQDVNLAEDTQDGAWLAIQAQAIFDTDDAIVGVYNGFSPTYAQGVYLSSLIKINGLQRETPSNSTAPCTLVGQAGRTIFSGIVVDGFGNQWTLPPNLTFPVGGALVSTLTCAVPGAITLASGSTTSGMNGGLTFVTFIPGWQSITTTSDAAPGEPIETDAALRQRQSISTGLPAQTPLASILAAVANVPGVEEYAVYENDTAFTDENGIPDHSIALIVLGGDVQTIAATIAAKKNPGCGTFGSISTVVIDPSGVPNIINFSELVQIQAYFVIGLTPLTGYLSTTGTLAVNAVAALLNSFIIGQNALVTKLFSAANLSGDAALSVAGGLTQQQLEVLSATYDLNYIYLGTAPSPVTQTDIIVEYNQEVVSSPANGSVVIV